MTGMMLMMTIALTAAISSATVRQVSVCVCLKLLRSWKDIVTPASHVQSLSRYMCWSA